MEQQYKSCDENNPTLDVTHLSQLSGGELWVAALCHTHTQLSAGIRIATHCTSPARLHLAAIMISHLLHRGVIVSTGLHNDTMQMRTLSLSQKWKWRASRDDEVQTRTSAAAPAVVGGAAAFA